MAAADGRCGDRPVSSGRPGCLLRRLSESGLETAGYRADSLAEAAAYEPDDGIYTLANTRAGGKVAGLNLHFDRLEDSARREGIPLRLDRTAVRQGLRLMLHELGASDMRFRITVPRSGRPLSLSVEPFSGYPPEIYLDGIRCITVHDTVRTHAESKTTAWMHLRVTISSQLPAGVSEAILCDADGRMLEGTSSNFYAVPGGGRGTLRTAGEGVLAGTAQRILFESARGLCEVEREAPLAGELRLYSEAFITSSSRDIVPVVEIDGVRIGAGAPGTLTASLRQAYAVWIEKHLEPL